MKLHVKWISSIVLLMALPFVWKGSDFVSKNMTKATVVDPLKIATCRFQYLQAKEKMRELQAHLFASLKEYKRMKTLHAQENIVSDKALQQAYATCISDYAKWQAAKASFAYQNESLCLEWGKEIQGLIAEGGKLYKEIIAETRRLLQVNIPVGTKMTILPEIAIQTQSTGEKGKGKILSAELVSKVPHVNRETQALSLFYSVKENELELVPGSSVVAHLEKNPSCKLLGLNDKRSGH